MSVVSRRNIILRGMRDGLPIGLGYFAVAFSLGIIAGKAGLNALTGFLSSLFTRASAGEYGVYSLIISNGTYLEAVLISIIANLRYLLMNTALSQRFSCGTSLFKRMLVGVCCTDEIFGIAIGYAGNLPPLYVYSATAVAAPMWAAGTACGIAAGGVLSVRLVSALGVALYGMFIAVVIPAGKKDKAVLAAVALSYASSFAFSYLPYISKVSSGMRTIILTIGISALAAVIRPVKGDDKEEET